MVHRQNKVKRAKGSGRIFGEISGRILFMAVPSIKDTGLKVLRANDRYIIVDFQVRRNFPAVQIFI